MSREYNRLSNTVLESLKDKDDGRSDPDGKFPRREYIGVSSVNNIARGTRTKNVYIGGSVPGINLNLNAEATSEYPNNQVKETASGHIIEYDDTYGRERIMMRHRTGSGVEMRSDGTVIISSTANTIRLSLGDEKVIIEGDVEIAYQQNVKMRVGGDFDLDVDGNYNINVQGDKVETIKGSVIQDVGRNYEAAVTKNKSETILGFDNKTVLGDKNIIVKGNIDYTVEGTYENSVKGTLITTSEGNISLTSPDINIAGNDVSVISSTGTFGGDNVTLYSKNIFATSSTFTEGVTAPTFHGALEGNAKTATQAGRSGTAGALGAGGSAGTEVNTATNTNQTTQPTTARIDAILNTSDIGVKEVEVDTNMKNIIDRTSNYGGITKHDVTLKRHRSISKDPNTLNNEDYIAAVFSEGILNPAGAVIIPEKTGQVHPKSSTVFRGSSSIGTKNGKGLFNI